ncbi:MAG: 4Fe-4S binding protein [Spirochaetales bacterium]|nr:4Fe-4S binding protein [Spirochaetales bacterium]
MIRQKIRKSITFISFLLYPITMFYFSPYLIIDAASKGLVSGSFIIFVTLFLSSLLVGRFFCGWLCPGAGMQNPLIDMKVVTKPIKKGAWIKFLFWAPWIVLIVFVFIISGRLKGIDFFYSTHNGISISDPLAYIIYYAVITIIIGLNFIFGKRGFCKYLCWISPFMIIGRKIRNIFNYPSLRLKVNSTLCNQCRKCNDSCPMSIDVCDLVQKGNMEHYECTLCGSCVDTCPQKAIKFGF